MEDEPAAPGKRRIKLTCIECFRRKIKCDKNIPCDPCIKRGHGAHCTRDELEAPMTRAYRARGGSKIPDDSVRILLDRIGQLEARLQQPRTPGQESRDTSPEAPDQSILSVEDRITATSPGFSVSASANNDDAATVLEFLAWGRKKDADFGVAAENNSGPRHLSLHQSDEALATGNIWDGSKDAHLDVVEALLPSRAHILELVAYHKASLLWYHGSYSGIIFNNDLDVFLTEHEGSIRHQGLNLQWLALLFAVLTGSLTCASSSTCRSWGFSEAERSVLSGKWYEAVVTCLNIARYMDTHTIYSVQAISTLTIAAHILGKSNSQSVLLASAGRIAQSLGLHRLGSETALISVDQLRRREAGRRVFNQLCTQDWFQIPFSESYSLNPRFISAAKPMNCNDDDMAVQPQSTPTQASYCNYRYEIAALMPQLLDATASCNTLFTKYQQVLQYDDKMRKLATAYMPTFLSTNAPVAEDWPIYVGWARRSLAICAAHKIIMIHRKFLGVSFTNSAFSFTRRTCIAASKTILKEAVSANDENGPVLWIEQAFSVAAGIILSLDIFHRAVEEKEFKEHQNLVEVAISYLRRFENSKIASRGVQLLSALQQELRDGGTINTRKRGRNNHERHASPSQKRRRIFNVEKFINSVSQNLEITTPNATSDGELLDGIEEAAWGTFMDTLPSQTGFGSQNLFDDLLSFQF